MDLQATGTSRPCENVLHMPAHVRPRGARSCMLCLAPGAHSPWPAAAHIHCTRTEEHFVDGDAGLHDPLEHVEEGHSVRRHAHDWAVRRGGELAHLRSQRGGEGRCVCVCGGGGGARATVRGGPLTHTPSWSQGPFGARRHAQRRPGAHLHRAPVVLHGVPGHQLPQVRHAAILWQRPAQRQIRRYRGAVRGLHERQRVLRRWSAQPGEWLRESEDTLLFLC